MRYFLFIDESGDANCFKKDTRFDAFCLCGIIISEDSYSLLKSQMDAIKMKFWGRTDFCFHSIKMRKQEGVFSNFQNKDLLSNFYIDIEELLTNINYEILSCVILKDKYRSQYPKRNKAYETALEFVCERAAFIVNRKGAKLHICLENRQRSKNRELYRYYNSFITNGTRFNGPTEFRNLSPKLHFKNKVDLVHGLQLADLCAYPIAFKFLHPEREQKTYKVIEKKIHRHYFTGEIMGCGLKVFP